MAVDLRSMVAVVGVGCTKFGELYEQSAQHLICDAVGKRQKKAPNTGFSRYRLCCSRTGCVLPEMAR